MTQTPLAVPEQINSLDTVLARARAVIDVEIQALEDLRDRLDHQFVRAVELIEACLGRVIITGMGKSGLIGKKIAATLSSTGTPAYFLHPAEGSHGDLGMLMKQDTIIAISNSGETPEILGILPLIKRFGIPLIAMTGRTNSTLAQQSDVVLNIEVQQEACPLGLAPTASTTATLALGDALAVVLLERRGFSPEDFALFHPAGSLGKRLLLKVKDVMRQGEDLPLIPEGTPFMEALLETSLKKMGMGIIVNRQGKLQGVLTDGDIRRALMRFNDPRTIQLEDVMTRNPKLAEPEELAVSALRRMEEHQITVLVICSDEGIPIGAIHMHDLLKAGLT
ncbi:MAG TPA: KpsF/GutQ family sugar-phosphate isomerase [Oculatellaceae cyanobacterium]|jgi:arabinose-5-phosphate isomerase